MQTIFADLKNHTLTHTIVVVVADLINFGCFHINIGFIFLHYRHSAEYDIEKSMSQQCCSYYHDYGSGYPAYP